MWKTLANTSNPAIIPSSLQRRSTEDILSSETIELVVISSFGISSISAFFIILSTLL